MSKYDEYFVQICIRPISAKQIYLDDIFGIFNSRACEGKVKFAFKSDQTWNRTRTIKFVPQFSYC